VVSLFNNLKILSKIKLGRGAGLKPMSSASIYGNPAYFAIFNLLIFLGKGLKNKVKSDAKYLKFLPLLQSFYLKKCRYKIQQTFVPNTNKILLVFLSAIFEYLQPTKKR
jgi:hypothetical protein